MRNLTVNDIMTSRVVSVRPDASFKEIVSLMHDHEISGVPVVKDDGMTLIGIVTEADLLRAEDDLRARPERRPRGLSWIVHPSDAERVERRAGTATAADLMTDQVVTVSPTTPLAQAVRTLLAARVKRLPVVDDDGRVVGIASRRDLLTPFLRDDGEIRHEIEEDLLRRVRWDGEPEVDVTIREGAVTLHGRMRRRSEAEMLVRLVQAVAGVTSVDERLRWEIDDQQPPPIRPFLPGDPVHPQG